MEEVEEELRALKALIVSIPRLTDTVSAAGMNPPSSLVSNRHHNKTILYLNYDASLKLSTTVKPVLNDHSQKTQIGFQDQNRFMQVQKYCRMLQGEHSAILSTCVKLLLVTCIKIFVLSIVEWLFYTSFTVR